MVRTAIALKATMAVHLAGLWLLQIQGQCAGAEDASHARSTEITATAYDQSWQITAYAAEADLTHQRVFDIAFETNGNVWIAADDGLRLYDGFNWRKFGTNSGLPSSFVRALLVTPQGDLWVGSDKGAGVFDWQRKRYDTRGSEMNLAGPNVRQICEDPDGTVWFCCDQWPDSSSGRGGLTSYRGGRWETFDSRRGLPLDYVIGYFRDSIGRQFAMTPHGWAQRRGEGWGLPQEPGFEAEECVLHMAESGNGTLFAQGEKLLLVRTDGRWQVDNSGTVIVGSTRQGDVIAARWYRTRGVAQFELWNGSRFIPASSQVSCPPGARFYRMRQSPDGAI